jgi:hypothetical protein
MIFVYKGTISRGINCFKRGYKPRSNLVKDENGDLLADSHNILNRWKNYFSQLLNVHRASDVRPIEIHTAEPLVLDPSPFEFEIVEKLKTNIKSRVNLDSFTAISMSIV